MVTSLLECLGKEHGVIFERAQLLERAVLGCMGSEMQLSQAEYQRSVTPCIDIFEKIVEVHFRVEEYALFPIYRNKSPETSETVTEFVKEHSEMFDGFDKYRELDEYEQSISALNKLMDSLARHARKEDILFSSTSLTRDEAESALIAARAIGFPLQ